MADQATHPDSAEERGGSDYVLHVSDPKGSSEATPINPNISSSTNRGNRRSRVQIRPKKLWNQFANDTLTSARMHTVGSSSGSERSSDAGSGRQQTLLPPVEELAKETPTSPTSAPMHVLSFDSIIQSHKTTLNKQLKRLDTWTSETLYELPEMVGMPESGSLGAAVFGIIKGTVGSAILYLPRGFQVSGWAVAIPSILFATAMYIYNAYRLLECWKIEHDRDLRKMVEQVKNSAVEKGTAQNAHNLSHTPLLTYPELARRAFGPNYAILVDIGIASLQFGVCLTYLIFVPHNLFECTQVLLGVQVPKECFLWIMVLIELPLGWIKDIRKLTPTNVVATGLIAYGLFFVLVLAVQQGLEYDDVAQSSTFRVNLQALPAATDSWFLFVGTSFFMMEGSITLLVPLQESITSNTISDRDKFPKMNQTVTIAIVVFYVVFSIVCCGAFGDSIHTAMTASLDGTLATTIQLAYSVAVILTFPLQAFPAMEVLKNNLLGHHHAHTVDIDSHPKNSLLLPQLSGDLQRRILSTVVICLLGVVAVYAIDYLGNVVSILGSLFGIPLALVVPPLMHNILVEDASSFTRQLNFGVVGIGFLAMGAASFATLSSWEQGAE